MSNKICTSCKKEKPVNQFRKKGTHIDGYRSHCIECVKKEDRIYRSNHRESRRLYYLNWRHKNPQRHITSVLRRKYPQIEIIKIEEARKIQGKKCAICKTSNKRLNIDHNHITGLFRGLLCTSCNAGLGFFKDNPLFLQSAIEYLG